MLIRSELLLLPVYRERLFECRSTICTARSRNARSCLKIVDKGLADDDLDGWVNAADSHFKRGGPPIRCHSLLCKPASGLRRASVTGHRAQLATALLPQPENAFQPRNPRIET